MVRCWSSARRSKTRTAPSRNAAEQQPELTIPSPIGRIPSEVESPSHTVAGVEPSIYPKGWEQAMQSELEGHMKTGTFSMIDRVPEGRKPVGSKWCFDY